MKILVTGAAGFIGYHVCKNLLEKGHRVVGLDNINAYYDVGLKYARLKELGIGREAAEPWNTVVSGAQYGDNFHFVRMQLEDREHLPGLFEKQAFDVVCNLAAQAGVRYSLENPEAYIDSNISGFLNILECCRHYSVEHLVYASSSSVYGQNKKVPFKTSDRVDHPISLYAATKKSNELMAYTYSHLFGFATTGLRFFTVYGPWGRPDMAMFLFTDAILHNRPIKVFNHGRMERDFTYIDDIAEGVLRVVEQGPREEENSGVQSRIYNIGNSQSVKLLDFILALEKALGLEAQKEFLPMQAGDVERTWADVEDLIRDYNYSPDTPIEIGVERFIRWYKEYYKN